MPFPNVKLEFEQEWESILSKCSMNTIFMTPEWQYTWWKRFASDSDVIMHIARSEGSVTGVVPLLLKEKVVTFIGNSDVFDYMDFPVVQGVEKIFFQALLERLQTVEWDHIALESIPENSPTLALLPDLARKSGYAVSVSESDVTPFLELPSDWDEYLLGLRKKDRHELRRKLRKLETQEEFRQYEVDLLPENIQSEMDEFFTLMSKSASQKEEFLTVENKGFFVDIATKLSGKGQFRLFFMEIGSKKVASCICFDYNNDIFLYNSGYDPELSSFSVGLLNKALTIKTAVSESRSEYNFLRGTERYKYHLGAEDRKVFDMIIRRNQ